MSPDDDSDQGQEDPQSWNLYSYVRNNPLTRTDPDGHDCIDTSNFATDGTVAVTRGDSCANSLGPNLLGYGQPAQLVVKSFARLTYQQIISADQLETGQPFASARPTTMPQFTTEIYSPNELEWRKTHFSPPLGLTPFATASYASYSASQSSTRSGSYNDDYGNDDSGPDEPGILDD